MWDDIAVVEQPPTESDYPATEAPETGYGALVVWCAGPANSVRVRQRDISVHRVVIETTDAVGPVTRTERPRAQLDQDEIDADLNEYLAYAGIEPRPPGYRWFVKVPPELDPPELLWAEVNTALARLPAKANHPRDTKQALLGALPAILRSDKAVD